jgi:hypothetical protein
MDKSEFETLIGEKCFEWETINFVYTYHPSIHNVGGKHEMVEIYKHGYISAIRKMVPEAITAARREGCTIKHVVDKLSEYDVVAGYCYNIHGRSMRQVYSELVNLLGSNLPDEYFTLGRDWEMSEFPYSKRIAVYCCPGGSEGTYLHIDVLDGNKHENIILGKTCTDGKGAIISMYTAAAICADYLQSD